MARTNQACELLAAGLVNECHFASGQRARVGRVTNDRDRRRFVGRGHPRSCVCYSFGISTVSMT
jgi:hypothetical protein